MILTYGTWWVLRNAHRQHQRTGRFTSAQVRAAERRVRAAAALLAWTDREGIALSQLDQGAVERWAEGHPLPEEVADFVRWAHRRRLMDRLTVPHRPARDADVVMSEAERWELLRRCLHDPAMATELAAAGAVLLLYGIHLTRIIELTTAHLDTEPGTGAVPRGLRVSLSAPVIVVPPALGVLLSRLPIAPSWARSRPLIEPAERPDWLFPGRSAHGHVTASVIAKRLKSHGVGVRPSRSAALIALAADLPGSVVSSLFGISMAAAVQWSRRAGRDGNAYVSAEAAARAQTREA